MPARALARHSGHGPGASVPARATAAPRPPRVGTAAEISRGGDRSRSPVCGGNTLTYNPRHHNLNPSPTLRELQVTDHVGLTLARAGGRSSSTPAPSPGFADRALSRAKPPRRGEQRGGVGEERGETDPPSPPTPPSGASRVPSSRHPAPRLLPCPLSPAFKEPGGPGGIFLVASFSFTFSFSSISEHSERRELGGTRGEPEREWGKS